MSVLERFYNNKKILALKTCHYPETTDLTLVKHLNLITDFMKFDLFYLLFFTSIIRFLA